MAKNRMAGAASLGHILAMRDYDLIARVIRCCESLDAPSSDPATIASLVHMSEADFQRLVIRWAGLPAKAFLQSLTVSGTREMLQKGKQALHTALAPVQPQVNPATKAISLPASSSPIHAHAQKKGVRTSPRATSVSGLKETIRAGVAECPFGLCLLAECSHGICHLSFVETQELESPWNELVNDWPEARIERDDTAISRLTEVIFNPKTGVGPTKSLSRWDSGEEAQRLGHQPPAEARPPRATSFFEFNISTSCKDLANLPLYVSGTHFQLSVWEFLLTIPAGTLLRYGDVARGIGRPSATRAVGTAVGRNPIAYLIPCHRVIQETGIIGNYHWSPTRKKAMLAWENAQQQHR